MGNELSSFQHSQYGVPYLTAVIYACMKGREGERKREERKREKRKRKRECYLIHSRTHVLVGLAHGDFFPKRTSCGPTERALEHKHTYSQIYGHCLIKCDNGWQL